jgi:hypothetical protein
MRWSFKRADEFKAWTSFSRHSLRFSGRGVHLAERAPCITVFLPAKAGQMKVMNVFRAVQ